ncbi:hypothetical protein O3G_MSEX010365 [Manduca sexta]|uniref:Protein unzipped n=1 Tax=Manduca sexta TaxID=7130 RepID=A0A922CT97_MANSE|nr:hypothetical protein O3G_MSEX010365 [Manduca sexta]
MKINCHSGWWVVLLTATLAVTVSAEAGVGLYYARLKQVITSSTLKWTTLNKDVMTNYVIGANSEKGLIYLCRARHERDMILGQLKPDYTSCAVSGSKSYNNFEVLENIENASLIYWVPWLKFNSKPNGAVVVDSSVDSVFIARMEASSGYSHYIGRIAYESAIGRLITFDDKNNELIENSGEILVEIEPISYKLENVELDIGTEHVRQNDPEVFEERILRNDDEVAATVTTEIEYEYNYTVSWGHGHGIAIGLNTTIEMSDGTSFPQIQWANPSTERKTKLYKLERFLEPGTACNVTFRGNRTDRDVQYTATLITSYNGKDSRSRQMRGQRIENTLEVEAIYGEIYFVGNNSLVPTTTTTTTTTTSTTTTTPLPTVPPAPEENDIAIPIKKPESSNDLSMSNNMIGNGDENVGNSPVKEDDINRSVVGGLGSKPNGANINKIMSYTLFISMCALLL